jgi:predicted SAM-dependent methyltransferase
MSQVHYDRGVVAIRALLSGASSYVPALGRWRKQGTGGTVSARYCYSVWLRHLVHAHRSGLNVDPKTIAELGPGDSLGMGLCALLTGAEQYFAFDVVEFANLQRNISVFDSLIPLLKSRVKIPGLDEFPDVKPSLESYEFPSHILTPERMEKALSPERIERIRKSLNRATGTEGVIQYRVPWFAAEIIDKESVDLIYSQAVLEHVVDLPAAYTAMQHWLKPGGYLSHQIDLRCHGTARDWNGHWAYSKFAWKLIQGARPYLLNREPASRHVEMLENAGFLVTHTSRDWKNSSLTKREFADPFQEMSEEDSTTSGIFIQALKKSQG